MRKRRRRIETRIAMRFVRRWIRQETSSLGGRRRGRDANDPCCDGIDVPHVPLNLRLAGE